MIWYLAKAIWHLDSIDKQMSDSDSIWAKFNKYLSYRASNSGQSNGYIAARDLCTMRAGHCHGERWVQLRIQFSVVAMDLPPFQTGLLSALLYVICSGTRWWCMGYFPYKSHSGVRHSLVCSYMLFSLATVTPFVVTHSIVTLRHSNVTSSAPGQFLTETTCTRPSSHTYL